MATTFAPTPQRIYNSGAFNQVEFLNPQPSEITRGIQDSLQGRLSSEYDLILNHEASLMIGINNHGKAHVIHYHGTDSIIAVGDILCQVAGFNLRDKQFKPTDQTAVQDILSDISNRPLAITLRNEPMQQVEQLMGLLEFDEQSPVAFPLLDGLRQLVYDTPVEIRHPASPSLFPWSASTTTTLFHLVLFDDIFLLCLPIPGNRFVIRHVYAIEDVRVHDLIDQPRNFRLNLDGGDSLTFCAPDDETKGLWMNYFTTTVLSAVTLCPWATGRGWQHHIITGTVFSIAKHSDVDELNHFVAHLSSKEIVTILNSQDADATTPLMYATMAGSVDMIEQLIQYGAEIDSKTNTFGLTALHYAGMYQKPDSIQALLGAGATVDVKDKNGWTALMHSALNEDPLLDKQIDFKSRDAKACIELLVAHGADINAEDYDCMTALEHNICCDVDRSRVLLESGASINAKLIGGNTLLHLACDSRLAPVRAQTVGLLLQWGAQANQVNEHHQTPLHVLVESKFNATFAPPMSNCTRTSSRSFTRALSENLSRSYSTSVIVSKAGRLSVPMAGSVSRGDAQHRIVAAELLLCHGARTDIKDAKGHSIQGLFHKLSGCHIRGSQKVWSQRGRQVATRSILERAENSTQWMEDTISPDCLICRTRFDVLHRRHHCRLCAKLLCAKCTSKSILLPNGSSQRVCDGCYNFARYEVAREEEKNNQNKRLYIRESS